MNDVIEVLIVAPIRYEGWRVMVLQPGRGTIVLKAVNETAAEMMADSLNAVIREHERVDQP